LALWSEAAFADQPVDGPHGDDTSREIVVYGHAVDQGVFAGVAPENELTAADIAAHGADTVGDLLGQLAGEVDSSVDGPVILINGRQVAGVSDVADLPAEAVSRIQALPNRVAGQLGQSPTRRVINVVIKDNHRQVTGNTEFGFATAGGGRSYRGELNLLRIKAGNRESLVLRAQRFDPLFESDRNIVTEAGGVPYDLVGNVLSYPVSGVEIDPSLSALAGRLTTIAGVPSGTASPTLADFAANANLARFTDVRPFRTLSAERQLYSANGNVTRNFGNTLLSMNMRAEWTETTAQSGLPSVLLRLPAGTAFSPFTRDVSIARYLGDPLLQQGRSANFDFNGNLTTPIGKWRLQVIAILGHHVAQTDSDVFDPAALQAAVVAGTLNPFGTLPRELTAADRSVAHLRNDTGLLQATFAGPLLQLPAGPVRAAISAKLRTDRLSGRSEFLSVTQISEYKRDEAGVQANFQVPLLGDKSLVGNLALNFNGALRQIGKVGTVTDYGAGILWRPVPTISLNGLVNIERMAPSGRTLSDPVVVNENYRIFDFVTNQTVQVRYLAGGNPDLPTARQRTLLVSATLTPFERTNLSLTADFSSRRSTDVQASLPPISGDVQAAFPDRFVRDANGVLILVDSRPVTFAYDNSDQVHWRIDYHGAIGGRRKSSDPGGQGRAPSDGAFSADGSLRVNFTLEHTWTLKWARRARAGLPEVDLLSGGAIGYGGGLPRHLMRFSLNLAARGIGGQIDGSWRSATTIRSGAAISPSDLFFSAHGTFDARVFADLGTLFPKDPTFKGFRITIAASNLFDAQQRVRDHSGAAPLSYQPYLQEPFGRTITIGLRKVF
jgi:hypothetical protein